MIRKYLYILLLAVICLVMTSSITQVSANIINKEIHVDFHQDIENQVITEGLATDCVAISINEVMVVAINVKGVFLSSKEREIKNTIKDIVFKNKPTIKQIEVFTTVKEFHALKNVKKMYESGASVDEIREYIFKLYPNFKLR